MGESEYQTRVFDQLRQFYSVFKFKRQWFIADDVNTGIQEALCNLKMTVMWCHNDDTFNAVITCGLCVYHCWISAVNPLTVHRQFVCRLTRFIVVA